MLLYSGSNFSALLYKSGDKYQFTHQLFIVFLNLIFYLGACSNDVNINEEWEDKTIVYCVLNQKDTAHYVRIQHAFYSVVNNYSSTSEPDSIYYNEELDVKLERWKDDQLVEILILEKTNDILKDSGYFTTENHVLYKTKNTLYPDSKYELKIFIASLEKSVSASTFLINDFTLNEETARYFSKPINFSLNSTFPYGWITSEYGKQFQPIIIFNYSKTTYTSFED